MGIKSNLGTSVLKYTVAIVIFFSVFLFGCRSDFVEGIQVVDISTSTGILKFPLEFAESLRHQEIHKEDKTIEIFSMVTSDCEVELYRFIFGEYDSGELIGYFEGLPITLTMYSYDDVDFPDDDTRGLYFSMIESVNTVLKSIYADERFGKDPSQTVEMNLKCQMSYWSLYLPDSMEWEELVNDGSYQAIFYGKIAGEKVMLYSVYLGESDAPTVLGTMIVDGVAKTVAVENYDIEPARDWTDEDLMQAGYMMGTINDVINTIKSSPFFSE